MAGDPRLPGSMKKPSILRSRGQQTSYSYKNENKHFTKAGWSRVRITLPSHFHFFGFSGSSALGPNALRRWFLWTLSTILGGWWGVRGRVPWEETDQRQSPGRGLAVTRSLSQRPWDSPFSVFCPHASFLRPPMAQPRSCQTSFSHLCALPLMLDFMALFLPQGPDFWQEGCFLHKAHHRNHLGVFIKTRNALPKNRGASVSLGNPDSWPWGRAGDQKFLCVILVIKLGKRCHFPKVLDPQTLHVMYNLKTPSKSRKKYLYMVLAKSYYFNFSILFQISMIARVSWSISNVLLLMIIICKIQFYFFLLYGWLVLCKHYNFIPNPTIF